MQTQVSLCTRVEVKADVSVRVCPFRPIIRSETFNMHYKARKSTESFLGIYLFSFILFYYHNANELAFIHTRANFSA